MARPNQSTPAPRAPAPLPTLASGASSAQAPKVRRKPPFLLAFLPERWVVLLGCVVPSLQEYSLEHGINGCKEVMRDDGTGRQQKVLVIDEALNNLHSKGGREIPWDVEDEPYIVEAWPDHWVTRWTGLTPGSAHMEVDLEGYVDFIQRLQDRGILPLPETRHLDRLAAGLRQDLEESVKTSGEDSHRVRQLGQQLEAVDRELRRARDAELDLEERQAERAAERSERQATRKKGRKLPAVQKGEGGEDDPPPEE